MGRYLDPEDLKPFADIARDKAEAMIADAEAMAALLAPCILTDEFAESESKISALRAILRGAVLRWHDVGVAGRSSVQQSAGPYSETNSFDTSQSRKGMFWPSEIAQLQALCRSIGDGSNAAFSIDTAPSSSGGLHWLPMDYCA